MLTTINDRVRYLNKNNNANERENFSKWWKELIEHYGTSTTYYTHGYNLSSHNYLYGEDPTSKYRKIEDVIFMTDITNDSLMLSKFGIMADCDMTAVIHISSYYEKFGCGYEPKAGDLIQLTEYGADRPGGRVAPIYEITERDDEYLPMTNPLLGHYVWYIKCKRFEYSYEPGIETGPNNKQINDSGDYGRLAGGENPEELFQPYPDSVQNDAKCIYDYYSEDPSVLDSSPNHFIPPEQLPCPPDLVVTGLSAVSGLYHKQELFTQQEQQGVNKSAEIQEFIGLNWDNFMLRKLVEQNGNLKTFVIETSSKSDDDIYYTTDLSAVDIFQAKGGLF